MRARMGIGGRDWVNSVSSTSVLLILYLINLSQSQIHLPKGKSFSFTQSYYNTTILENSVGKTYVTVTSKMGIYVGDTQRHDLNFAIVDGDPGKIFKTEARQVGDFVFLRIRTRSSSNTINREQQDLYKLSIRSNVKQKTSSTFAANTTVYISVIDANDLSPLFEPTFYEVEVAETASIHQSLVKVGAFDADLGINSEIYYSFAVRTETFAIHPTSGVVTLTRKLSFTEKSFYQLDVLAGDRGSTKGKGDRRNRASLQVRILPVNQFSPKIDVRERPTIVEHGKLGTIYAILGVTDLDKGKNGQIDRVVISEGDPDGNFAVEKRQTGNEYIIIVVKMIDRETKPNGFNLSVVAFDQGIPVRSTNKSIHVQVQDINDHAPKFDASSYNFSVNECLPIGTPVSFLEALDTDSSKNAEIVYSIVSGNPLFKINSLTGLLSISSRLDAENVTTVNFVVRAEDRANRESRKTSQTLVTVDILDCNDNSPVFDDVPSLVFIEENQPLTSTAYVVHASDPDSGENGFISYSIVNIDDVPFAIDHFSGKIFNNQILDFELMRNVYHLVIRATDWGTPFKRETEIILKIKVKDTNDNTPKFEKIDCTRYLARDAPAGTELVVVSAVDFDVGNIVSYRIMSGNDDLCFDLDPSSGSLRTNCSFKNQREDRRRISIVAYDGTNFADPIFVNVSLVNNRKSPNDGVGVVCQETSAVRELANLLHIMQQNNLDSDREMLPTTANYLSGNLNSPKFLSNQTNTFSVKEGLGAGVRIARLMAGDDDQGFDGRLQFVISTGNVGDVFEVDTYSGDLYAMRQLDREVKDRYLLNVTVSDMGIPPKSDFKVFEIKKKKVPTATLR